LWLDLFNLGKAWLVVFSVTQIFGTYIFNHQINVGLENLKETQVLFGVDNLYHKD
jgi:hypothetical protein